MTSLADFDNPHAGEWITPIKRGYLLKCCDCGLVHRIDFRVLKIHKNRKRATIQGARYVNQFRVYRFDDDQGSPNAQVPA